MRYFTYDDEYSEIAGGQTYVETDNGYTLRQVTVNPPHFLASNIDHPPGGMTLGEGQVDYDDLIPDQVTEITPAVFEAVWESVLVQREIIWQRSQHDYPLGRPVHGTLLVFYPQGVIVQLDDETLGIADYTACRASTTPNNLYPGHRVTAIVKGYDIQQQWIELDDPQVHAERIW